MRILIIDGQGGKIGRSVAESLLRETPEHEISVIGTNAIATSNMLKSGVKKAATGENPVVVTAPRADIIIGPIGIAIADSMMGEITEKMAAAVGRSGAKRIFIPMSRCDNIVAGAEDVTLSEAVKRVVAIVKEISGKAASS